MSETNVDNNNTVEMMIRAFLLYQKYIALDAPFQINICSENRLIFINLMPSLSDWLNGSNKDPMDNKQKMKFLYSLFDESIFDQKILMRSAFIRYKATLLFAEFKKVWISRQTRKPTA